jgi:hypothetical protein
MNANNINGRNKMTAAQMNTFADRIRQGLNWDGTANPELRRFNDAIRAQRTEFVRLHPWARELEPRTIEARQRRGAWYRENSGRLASLLVIPMAWALAQGQGILDVAANGRPGQPHYFRLAVEALANGNLAAADRFINGTGTENRLGGFVGQLIAAGFGPAAFAFQTAWEQALQRGRENAAAITSEYAP